MTDIKSPLDKLPLVEVAADRTVRNNHSWMTWFNSLYEKLRGPLWEDMTADLSSASPGASAPTMVALNGGPYRAPAFSVGDSLDVTFHVTHDVKPGALFYPHVHWTTDGTNAGTATWRISHQMAKGHGQEAFPAATMIDVVGTASGTAWNHEITEVSDAQALAMPEVDSLICINLELVAKSGFGTPADDVIGLYCDLHYQRDRFGTPNKAPNFYQR